MSKNYDLVILGGGMGGYVSAIRARQLGKTVALVEKAKIGGTCLHKGCIPTKSLLKSAEVFQTVKKCGEFGIKVKDIALNYVDAFKRKNDVVDKLYQGLQQLMKKHQIDMYHGVARLLGPSIFSPLAGAVSVEMNDQTETLIGKNVLIATGAKPRVLKNIPIDHQRVLTSDDLLTLDKLPDSIIIVGGGVIGVEWASMMLDFGVKVTLIEREQTLLKEFDRDAQVEVINQLKQRGLNVYVNVDVRKTEVTKQVCELTIDIDGNEKVLSSSHVLVSVGRIANTDDLGLSNTDIEQDDYGFIKVNDSFQTKESHIYAVGDVIGGKQLAHVASAEGKQAIAAMFDEPSDPSALKYIPSGIYATPEVASVGLTETEAKSIFKQVKAVKFPFQALGKALVSGETSGFVKLIIDQASHDCVGITIVGEKATELISEATLALLLNASIEELGEVIHPHPSLSEAIGEGSLLAVNQPIHI